MATSTMMFLLMCRFLLCPSVIWIIKQANKKMIQFRRNVYVFHSHSCGCMQDYYRSLRLVFNDQWVHVRDYIYRQRACCYNYRKSLRVCHGIMLLSFLLRTNFRDIHGKTNGLILALLTVFAASAKIVSTVFVSAHYAMSTRDSLALGGLMIMTFLAGPIFFLKSKTRKRCNRYKVRSI